MERTPSRCLETSLRSVAGEVATLERIGAAPPVSAVLSRAAKSVDSLGDGHAFAANGILPKQEEDEFLRSMESLAEESACDLMG